MKVLRIHRVDGKLLMAIYSIYKDVKAVVQVDNLSELFKFDSYSNRDAVCPHYC